MPFRNAFPRPFTENSVRQHAPTLAGVFGITNAREWIYIGQSRNVRDSLLDLLRPKAVFGDLDPTGFVYEACDGSLLSSRQDRLVLENEPRCNRSQERAR